MVNYFNAATSEISRLSRNKRCYEKELKSTFLLLQSTLIIHLCNFQVVKHSFEGLYVQTSAVLAGRPTARAGLIIRIRAETVAR